MTGTFRHLISILLFFLALGAVMAQELSQNVKGVVRDQASQYPLPGVVVLLESPDSTYYGLTNVDGEFAISRVKPGHYTLKSQMVGYQEAIIQDVQVSTGRSPEIDVFLGESVTNLDEVVVNSKQNAGSAQNNFALLSSRSFSVEETQKYPGSFEDPARMASVFSGVSSDPHGNNDIIVRGNSPRGILWRIEGVEAPNPNHFGGDGASGGPISMIANSVLANSDFYTSAFPAEFGNASSGVFDIKFRKGNDEKREYSVDLNTLGVRLSAEGPFKKGKKASYLAHYRYSTLGLMNQVGIILADGGTPNYQDAAFKVFVPLKKAGYISAFGLLGEGHINVDEKSTDDPELTIYKGKTQYYSGIVGINHFYFFDPNSSIKTSLAFSGIRNATTANELTSNLVDFAKTYDGSIDNGAVRFQSIYNKKLNSQHSFQTGVFADQLLYAQDVLGWDFESNSEKRYMDSKGSTSSLRGFAQWAFNPSEKWSFSTGLHYTYFGLNGSQAIDPRFGARWKLRPNHNLSFGFGLHSRHENASIYLVEVPDENGNLYQPNLDLGLSRSFHSVAGYEIYLNPSLRFKSEIYYQRLFNTIVEDDPNSTYALLNSSEGFTDRKLVNGGEGENYGIEFTLEKFFTKRYFFLATASLFESRYKANDGIWRSTRFNTNMVSNLLAGKEFDLSRNGKQKSLTISGKAVFSGGQYYVPIDLDASQQLGNAVYQEDLAYSQRHDPLGRFDLQVKLKTNKKKSTHEVLLDIQNVTNRETTVSYYYSNWEQKIKKNSQLQIVPMLGYKVTF